MAAPTDDAFAALPEGAVEALLNDIPALTDILLYHVVPGKVMAEDVVNLTAADTVLGEPLSIKVEDGAVMVNDAEVIITDIETANGVIHVIDSVLIPMAEEAAAASEEPTALPESGGTPNYGVFLALLAGGVFLALSGVALGLRTARVEK